MLDSDERKQIKRMLFERFNYAGLRVLLATADVKYEAVVPEKAQLNESVMLIVDVAQSQGWAPALLDAMIAEFEGRQSPLLQGDVETLRRVQKSMADRMGRGTALLQPFHSCFVRNNWPFVNRPAIHESFIKLSNPGGPRIVVLNGPSDSGKTYSKELAQYVSEVRPDLKIKVIYKDVGEGDYAYANAPDRLVRSILTEWRKGSTSIPEQLTQSSGYALELSEFLAASAPEEPKDVTWWIVIDGIAKITQITTENAPLLKFLHAFEKYIADSSLPLRLILLDLGEQNSLPDAAESVAVKVELNRLTVTDLMEHYFAVLHQANQQIAFDPELAKQKAQWVIDQVNSQPAPKVGSTQLKQYLLTATREMGFA